MAAKKGKKRSTTKKKVVTKKVNPPKKSFLSWLVNLSFWVVIIGGFLYITFFINIEGKTPYKRVKSLLGKSSIKNSDSDMVKPSIKLAQVRSSKKGISPIYRSEKIEKIDKKNISKKGIKKGRFVSKMEKEVPNSENRLQLNSLIKAKIE